MRRGFTLIESLMALVLFQIGVLALAATTVVAARDLATANRRVRAHAVAAYRVALLRGTACHATASGGLTRPGGLTERWSVAASGAGRIVADTVTIALPLGRTETVVATAWLLCDP